MIKLFRKEVEEDSPPDNENESGTEMITKVNQYNGADMAEFMVRMCRLYSYGSLSLRVGGGGGGIPIMELFQDGGI